jgi:hypothetical protein
MPFLSVKLQPGVHAEQTPLLLQAGVVQSNNIRWRDGLPEKLGGWQKFYYTLSGRTITTAPLVGPLREMWAWSDFNALDHLAVGGDGQAAAAGSPGGGLVVVTDGGIDITPGFSETNSPPTFTTTAGSPLVTIHDPAALGTNLYGSVVIGNYVAIDGLILYGAYPIVSVNNTTDIVINAVAPALAGVTAGGVVSTFTTNLTSPTSSASVCTVILPDNGFLVGQAVWFLPTTLTGSSSPPSPDIVIQGSYTVLSVIDANTFTIGLSVSAANVVGPIAENGGHVQLTYWVVNEPAYPGGGWGGGGWGEGGWGGTGVVVAPVNGTPLTAANIGQPTLDWCLTNFGEELIAQPDGYGFFRWSLDSGLTTARPIPQAPIAATGFFLAMPEQQLVAYGASTGSSGQQDPMLVRWCDNADYTDWTASATNQAGSYRLTRGSKIIGGMQSPLQAVLWTDVGFWLMTYIGYPDVWGFMEIAQECGLIAKKAAGVCGQQLFWMSRDKFWTYMNGQVAPLPCEVWDAVFQNLNTSLLDRIRCGTNSGFDEVWWFYPSKATLQAGALQENDSYVKFNRVTGEWDYGTPIDVFGQGSSGGLMVSDWLDNNVFGHPISAMTQPSGTQSQLMWHEMGSNADVVPMDWWFRTGLFLLSEGEDFIFVDRCRPDFRWQKFSDPLTTSAQVQITLYTQEDDGNPNNPPVAYGPFICTNASGQFDPRARGRYFSLKVEGSDLNSFARLGSVKFRFAPDGRAG